MISGLAQLRYTERNTKSARSNFVTVSLALLVHGDFTSSTLQQRDSSYSARSNTRESGTRPIKASGSGPCGRCFWSLMRKYSLQKVILIGQPRSRNDSPPHGKKAATLTGRCGGISKAIKLVCRVSKPFQIMFLAVGTLTALVAFRSSDILPQVRNVHGT
jgi:hypothetical protein